MTRRPTRGDPWGVPVNVGPAVNTPYSENLPMLLGDGLFLFFRSDRPGGYGQEDLYVTTRTNLSDSWGPAVNLGPFVNSAGNEFYAYNRVTWAANPANAERKITVQGYNLYRKLSGQPSGTFTLWKTVDAATFSQEDRSTEIRQQTAYDYALTSFSDKGKESVKAVAQKTTSSTLKARMLES